MNKKNMIKDNDTVNKICDANQNVGCNSQSECRVEVCYRYLHHIYLSNSFICTISSVKHKHPLSILRFDHDL